MSLFSEKREPHAQRVALDIAPDSPSVGVTCTTSSYLCPWVKVLRQHVSLSSSARCLRPTNCFLQMRLCRLFDILMTRWCYGSFISLRHKHFRVIMCRSKSNRRLQESKLLNTNSGFIALVVFLSVFKEAEQNNSALFWLFEGAVCAPSF